MDGSRQVCANHIDKTKIWPKYRPSTRIVMSLLVEGKIKVEAVTDSILYHTLGHTQRGGPAWEGGGGLQHASTFGSAPDGEAQKKKCAFPGK